MHSPIHSIDINECADEDLNTCHMNATCSDTIGSFVCTCNEGFEGNGTSCAGRSIGHLYPASNLMIISDIDECLVDPPCNESAECTNTLGSYECTCLDGFEGDGFLCRGSYNS